MEYKIENKVPVPVVSVKGSRVSYAKYPFANMNVGDSFYADGKTVNQLVGASRYFARNNEGFKFTVRKEGNGCRVWRWA